MLQQKTASARASFCRLGDFSSFLIDRVAPLDLAAGLCLRSLLGHALLVELLDLAAQA
jgi:hypothetical protein